MDGIRLGPLADLRVIDCGTLLAGPMIATYLADFGADVIKVEHPRGDPLRSFGWQRDGVAAWWLTAGRNKRSCTIDLSRPAGADLLLELARDADVLIESFRPGTLERWSLGYERLAEANPALILVRVSGFGQSGPYRHRPGFGTLAEAMSGIASVLGYPDRPPIVPPFPLADGVAALFGTFATLAALLHRRSADAPRGQVIDVSLLESAFAFLGPHVTAYELTGAVETRKGSRAYFSAPRNVYATRDGRWVAVSTSAQSAANRLLEAIGRPELVADPRFSTPEGRLENADEVDRLIAEWVEQRSLADVLGEWDARGVTGAPVYTVEDLVADEHLRERGAIVEVDDPEAGPVRMHGVFPFFSDTPGEIRHPGRPLGADNESVFIGELGHSAEDLEAWRRAGII